MMDSQDFKCRLCGYTESEYNEELCRNICLRCNAMAEMTGIGVVTLDLDSGINFQGLQKTKGPIKRKHSSNTELKNHIKQMKPFKAEDMFYWLFEHQIESLRPFVTNFEEFKNFANILWERYLNGSGSGFDLKNTKTDDIILKKYPLGWGVPLDPNRAEDTLNIVPKEFYREMRAEKISEESDDEIIKHQKNAKKIKIEKMVKEKFNETMPEVKKNIEEDMDDENVVKLEEQIPKIEMKEEIYSSSDSDVSKFSDEDDPSYIHLYQLEGKAQKAVRILRKKRDCHVRYFGGRVKTEQIFMENNLLLLFFALHYSNLGTEHCCCLMDLWRLAKQGDIPFLKVSRFLPVDKFFMRHTVFQSMILRDIMPSFSDMKHYALHMAETLHLDIFLRPNRRDSLVQRMLSEHNLPVGLTQVINYVRINVENKIDKFYKLKDGHSIIRVGSKWGRFKMYSQHILFPEVSCLGYVFMALRIMMRFNNVFEVEVSRLVNEVEGSGIVDVREPRCFIWTDWLSDHYRPPTITTSKTWSDLAKAETAEEFLEEDVSIKSKFEDSLPQNGFVNNVGRFVQPYKKGTHEAVLEELVAPLVECGRISEKIRGDVDEERPGPRRDYGETSIGYLLDPEKWREGLRVGRWGEEDKRWLVVDRLVSMVKEAGPMCWRQWPLNGERYGRGIYEDLMETRINVTERHLLRTLVYNTGISYNTFHDTVDSLSRLMHAS